MPKYSELLDARTAAWRYRGEPGNYILVDKWGRAYAGRQSALGDRIGAALRKHRGHYSSAAFMVDHQDDPCVRAQRERSTVDRLVERGIPVRNRVRPSMPRACRRRRR